MAQILRKGKVRFIEGDTKKTVEDSGGRRIKVELYGEGFKSIDKLPWAYPLLPKTVQSIPKVNECVLVFVADSDNKESNRYYIGPIIDQPQDFYKANFEDVGKGQQDGQYALDDNPEMKASFDGAYPDIHDISIIGRKSEDIALKDGEVDIRCGIRLPNEDSKRGYTTFNASDHPAYIQLKYQRNIINNNKDSATSVINMVADKVNLISHKDIDKMNGNINVTDSKKLIKDQNTLQENLHPIICGDKLAEALEQFKVAFFEHVHENGLANKPPCNADATMALHTIDFRDFLSKNICTS